MKKMSIFYPRYTVKKITGLTKSTVAQQSGKLSVFVLGKIACVSLRFAS